MTWKPTGQPTVRRQRDRWVVRVDGLDPETGKHRPRQLGTYSSRRSAQTAASSFAAAGEVGGERGSVGHLVEQWAASRVDVGAGTRAMYEWAAARIARDLGAVRVDRLDRADVARWLDGLAVGGELSRRSIQIMRMVLRAALADAVESGQLRRSPAARVGMPRQVAKAEREREADAWTEDEVQRFLAAIAGHRWAAPIQLCVHYGLRRSELLGLRWSDVDLDTGVIRIERGLVEVHGQLQWTGRQERTVSPPRADRSSDGRGPRRASQVPVGGAPRRRPPVEDNDLVVAIKTGSPVSPVNFNRTLQRLVDRAGVPRLTSHGLRHTAATHMVRHADDIGEIRAAADLLGHSPDMLMRTYAHALPESVRTVTDKIGRRVRPTTR